MKKILALTFLLAVFPAFGATVYIDEYTANKPNTIYPAALTPPVAVQTVAIGGSSAQSAAFNARTVIIRVHADAICSILIGGTNPTATATNARFIAGQTEYFLVTPGDKLAVITNN